MDDETITELVALASAAWETADRFVQERHGDFERAYRRLRTQAEALNRRNGWAPDEDFETQFPTLEAQRRIDELDAQYGQSGLRSEVEPGEPVQRLLRHLAAWARGVSLAGMELRPRKD